MKNLWDASKAHSFQNDLLQQRVYASRLLGADENLVMHGGGNTSVKIKEQDIFGQSEEILYVKGSGWDLATIEKQGFAPVKLDVLKKLAQLPHLSDMNMVKNQRMAMTNPSAPNPSVEAILHAIIPFKFVDHTHADAVVTITNTPKGRKYIDEIYGPRVLVIPYVMPGFILAKKIFDMTRHADWSQIDAMILMHHGVFTFHDEAKQSYDRMIEIVSKAESFIKKKKIKSLSGKKGNNIEAVRLATIRKEVSAYHGAPLLAQINTSSEAAAFGRLEKLKTIASKGPLTPDHIIRTKRTPVIFSKNISKSLEKYARDYSAYFEKFHAENQVQLDSAPRWGVVPDIGAISFGPTIKHVKIIDDITRHTRQSIYQAEQLGGWRALPRKDLFEMEYWSLEQAKLKKKGKAKPFTGRIALVTGAASGIGESCVKKLVHSGAAVIALDLAAMNFESDQVFSIQCDITKPRQITKALKMGVDQFGGIDMLISNAGIFPSSATIEEMNSVTWQKSMDINLTGHQEILKQCIPFLKLGFDPAVIFIGSKNVAAPGPGAGAYSVAKAGLAQLARVAALELGKDQIRVNTIHPNAVFDTGVWDEEVLKARASHYDLSVDDYKRNNILKTDIKSADVADLAVTMLSPVFSKVTGAQIPIDGGNERVI